MIKIAVSGAAGRMGRTIYKTLIGSEHFEITFGVDSYPVSDLPYPVYRTFADSPLEADVVIDFSSPAALDDVLRYAARKNVRLVLATTGYDEDQLRRIEYASRQTAVFRASNMSLGINLLATLSKEAAKFLGDDYDVEIIETHHNQKLDAPSGTALFLADSINEVKAGVLEPVFGRHEHAKRRSGNEIGIHAVRGGTVVGKHDVMFLGSGEVVTLSHEAENKEVFVRGALRAAAFLMKQTPGLYDMQSILANYYAVTNVFTEDGVSLITLMSVPPQAFMKLLSDIKGKEINLDMISQNFNSDGNLAVSFTLSDRDLEAVEAMLGKAFSYSALSGKGKITAEGAGMIHKSGVALDVLSTIAGVGSGIYAVTTSETKITCCVDAAKLSEAEAALKEFYDI